MRRAPVLVFTTLVLAAAASPAATGGGTAIAFDPATWELSGDAAIETSDSGGTLSVASGRAVHRDLMMADGTIEFDLEVTPHRSFVFVAFRVEERGEHEEIYFRPHKSMLPDAIQYTPAYLGRGQWQLYHDTHSTAAAPLPAGEPIRVKIAIEGQLGVVWVGDMEEPRLRFFLARPRAEGRLALSSFRPAGGPEGVPMARFSNLTIRPGEVDASPLFVAEAFQVPRGRVSHWSLSPAFAPPEGAVRELPAATLAADGWRRVGATPRGGFVEIERHVTRPEGADRATVLARLTIAAEKAATHRLDLGFSDEVSVFLNGRLIVSANDDYSFNEPRRQGLLTLDQLAVYLPLAEGDNELVVAVTDRFGGWGLAGRFENVDGLTIEPR